MLADNNSQDFLDMQIENGVIELDAATYVRGRSYGSSLCIFDEFQNMTKHEAKSILTRIGFGSKIVILGDIEQIDAKNLDFFSNGLSYVIEKFKPYPIAAHITLTKGERSELATIASEIL